MLTYPHGILLFPLEFEMCYGIPISYFCLWTVNKKQCINGPAISDYNKRLILLSVIQLSGGHCMSLWFSWNFYFSKRQISIDLAKMLVWHKKACIVCLDFCNTDNRGKKTFYIWVNLLGQELFKIWKSNLRTGHPQRGFYLKKKLFHSETI